MILVCIISISMLPAKKRNSPKKKEIVPKQTIKVNDCVLVDTDVDLYQCVCVCVCVCVLVDTDIGLHQLRKKRNKEKEKFDLGLLQQHLYSACPIYIYI